MKLFDQEYFKVRTLVGDSGCWDWQLGKDVDGYGRAKSLPAHRESYKVFVGPIPEGICVCHTCDNPGCVNPDHLFLATNAENTADKVAKGRTYLPTAEHMAKLTQSVRDTWARGKEEQIAAMVRGRLSMSTEAKQAREDKLSRQLNGRYGRG